jgi:hypothetical protein
MSKESEASVQSFSWHRNHRTTAFSSKQVKLSIRQVLSFCSHLTLCHWHRQILPRSLPPGVTWLLCTLLHSDS